MRGTHDGITAAFGLTRGRGRWQPRRAPCCPDPSEGPFHADAGSRQPRAGRRGGRRAKASGDAAPEGAGRRSRRPVLGFRSGTAVLWLCKRRQVQRGRLRSQSVAYPSRGANQKRGRHPDAPSGPWPRLTLHTALRRPAARCPRRRHLVEMGRPPRDVCPASPCPVPSPHRAVDGATEQEWLAGAPRPGAALGSGRRTRGGREPGARPLCPQVIPSADMRGDVGTWLV